MTLTCLSLAWVAGVFLGSRFAPLPVSLFIALAPLILLLVRRLRKTAILTSLCLLALIGGALLYQTSLPSDSAIHLSSYNGKEVVLRGTVAADPEVRDQTTRLRLSSQELTYKDGKSFKVEGTAFIYVPLYSHYRYGDVLEVTGNLETPTSFDDFDYASYLSNQDIYSVMFYPRVSLVDTDQGNPVMNWIYDMRQHLADSLAGALPEPQASVAQGMLLGLRASIPDDVNSDFALSGTTHILAISGMNLSIMAGILVALGQWLWGKRHYLYVWLALGTIWFYAALTGAPPSVVRASVMASVFLLAELTGRQKNAAPALFLAAAVMAAANPRVLWDVSFQLSALAMAGLVYIYPPLGELSQRLAERMTSRYESIKSTMSFTLDSLAVTLAATLAVWPVLAAYFGRVSLASPLATLLAVPAMTPIIILGLATAICGLIYLPLGQIIGWLAWLFLSYLLWIAHLFARLPGASLEVSALSTTLILTYYLALGLTLWLVSRRRRIKMMAEFASEVA